MTTRWKRRTSPHGSARAQTPAPRSTGRPGVDTGLEVSSDSDRIVLSPFVGDGTVTVHPGPVVTIDNSVSDRRLGTVARSALGLSGEIEPGSANLATEVHRALRVRSRRAFVARRARVSVRNDRNGNITVTALKAGSEVDESKPVTGTTTVVPGDADATELGEALRQALDLAAARLD